MTLETAIPKPEPFTPYGNPAPANTKSPSQSRPFELDAALQDPQLFAEALGPPGTWETWFTILRAFYGLPLDAKQLETFREVANRNPPTAPCSQLWAVAGRRSGKSRIAGAILAYAAVCAILNPDNGLAPGETGHVLCFSPTKAQAKTVLEYAAAFLEMSPLLSGYLLDRTNDELRLTGNIVISTHPANFRHLRGRSVLAAVLDESAFFRSEESANPDIEIFRALLPALKPGAPLVGISSPFSKRGILFERFRASYGRPDPAVLVIKADTRTLNPTYDQAKIDEAFELDAVSAKSEFGAEFRSDLSTYIDENILRRCVVEKFYIGDALADRSFRYFGFADPSGGAGDSFTLALSHVDGERVVLDCVHEWPSPFAPDDVLDQISDILQEYRVASVHGDRYAAEWVASAFRQRGLAYLQAPGNKSELYASALPLFTGQRAIIPNHSQLIAQLCSLERRAAPSGREAIDHPRGMKDDVANAAAGALVVAAKTRYRGKPKPVRVEGLHNSEYSPLAW